MEVMGILTPNGSAAPEKLEIVYLWSFETLSTMDKTFGGGGISRKRDGTGWLHRSVGRRR
jgi:hypothetical protein